MHAIINEDPTSLVECGAGDKSLWQIIERGLQKQRPERFQNVTELGEALALWLYEHGIKEDLSGNSIRAVWLDAALSGGSVPEVRTVRPQADTGGAQRARSTGPITLSASNAETIYTLAPRSSVRKTRALYVGLPLFALALGAAGAWFAFSLQKAAPAAAASVLSAAAVAPAARATIEPAARAVPPPEQPDAAPSASAASQA